MQARAHYTIMQRGGWTKHDAMNIGRLRFQIDTHSCDTLNQYTHVMDVCERARYMDIVGKHTILKTQTTTTQHPIEYTPEIGNSCQTLSRHIQRLVGNIPDMDVPGGWDDDSEQDIKVATDGSVVLGVGCPSWAVATNNEDVLVSGGGPNDGDQLIASSYRSELGGIASGLAVIGTLARSGKIKV
jgi:hypothetical protein